MSLEREKDTRDNLREKIDNIEQQLNKENSRIHKINAVQDSLFSLKKNMDSCVNLLSKSLDGGVAKTSFDNLVADNNIEFNKTCRGFEEKSEMLRRRVIDLRNERDAAIQEYEDSIRDDDKD